MEMYLQVGVLKGPGGFQSDDFPVNGNAAVRVLVTRATARFQSDDFPVNGNFAQRVAMY